MAVHASKLWVFGMRFITYDKAEVLNENDLEVPDTQEMKVAVNAFHNEFF